MTYRRSIPVEFNHCDPAGIVFYPRYFEMTNSVVENFFREAVELPFARMMAEGNGVPTARIEIDFRAPSRLGDVLDFTLNVRELGRTSVTFAVTARCNDETRLSAILKLVWVGSDGRPDRWPDRIAAIMATHKEGQEQ